MYKGFKHSEETKRKISLKVRRFTPEEMKVKNKERTRIWREKYGKKWRRDYYIKNREKIIQQAYEYRKKRYKTDPKYKLRVDLHRAFYSSIRIIERFSKITKYGCTLIELKQHIESQFKEGMNWQNWGWHTWHIDHIKPISSFDLTDEKQLSEAIHYTNLRPMWAKDNLIKGNKYVLPF